MIGSIWDLTTGAGAASGFFCSFGASSFGAVSKISNLGAVSQSFTTASDGCLKASALLAKASDCCTGGVQGATSGAACGSLAAAWSGKAGSSDGEGSATSGKGSTTLLSFAAASTNTSMGSRLIGLAGLDARAL